MARFTLRQLELFAVLPDHPTLGSAAKALHVSESALSHALTELEAALGEQLCVRRKARGMHLTPTGRHFAARAREILRSTDTLVGELAEVRGEAAGAGRPGLLHRSGQQCPAVRAGGHRQAAARRGHWHHRGRPHRAAGGAGNRCRWTGHRVRHWPARELPARARLSNRGDGRTGRVAAVGRNKPTRPGRSVAPEPLIMLESAPSTGYTELMFAERDLTPTLRPGRSADRPRPGAGWAAAWDTAS